MILAANAVGEKHHSAYHRLFAAARWSLDELGLAVFSLILPLRQGTLRLVVDDTLARKRGLKVFGVGMHREGFASHHDPILSSRKTAIVNWAHCWVVLGVRIKLPFADRYFRLPILFRLYLSKQTIARKGGTYHAKPELDIYGRHDKGRIAECVARVYAAPDRPLKAVAVEPLTGGREIQAFYSTAHEASAEQVLTDYSSRYAIEDMVHEAKGQLGLEEPPGWTRRAVRRTAPVAMPLYSLVLPWFHAEGHRHYQAPNRPWYPKKPHASFADMRATPRCCSVRAEVLSMPPHDRPSENLLQALIHVVKHAA
jgi:hypothetical protein